MHSIRNERANCILKKKKWKIELGHAFGKKKHYAFNYKIKGKNVSWRKKMKKKKGDRTQLMEDQIQEWVSEWVSVLISSSFSSFFPRWGIQSSSFFPTWGIQTHAQTHVPNQLSNNWGTIIIYLSSHARQYFLQKIIKINVEALVSNNVKREVSFSFKKKSLIMFGMLLRRPWLVINSSSQ